MRATILNCTLKPSPSESNTEALARVVIDALEREDVETELVRVVDFDVKPGITNDEGDGDEWSQILEKVLAAEILVIATPTWIGQPSSVAKRVLERMDALLSETDDEDRPVAYNRVAGFNKDWSKTTGETAAQNFVAVARALAVNPVPAPPSG
jgi:multimeric flavodoxin WrbA